ncbi:DUF2254 domain-containing protein [Mesonia sediminis]|uniref:DUF2254 domain-containing protein n=1 Tax=Mesonia sediminis TaxID=1703946 RepID=A0ABW5SE09_9FLAO
MRNLYNKLVAFFHRIEENIAFYPSIISFLGFNFAMLMLYLEKRGVSSFVINYVPELVINNADTAKTLLSFLTGGIISIMVFSFSMVMVLLNQASSNFSPRVLPGLISQRNHQYVLGLYVATILYNTFTLVGINPKEDSQYQLPGFSVLLGIIFTVICFAAFLYFIHSISQSIQVNRILENIYNDAKNRLNRLIEGEQKNHKSCFPSTDNWHKYYSTETGYLQTFALNNLKLLCLKNEIKIKILPLKGAFVLAGVPLFLVNKSIDDELKEKILENFNFARGEIVLDNYALGFKQITEIGVKAMSPGINDPGTALNTIDYLTELFALRMKKRDETIIYENDQALVFLTTVNFAELLYQVLASYRTYCNHDIACVQKLLIMLKYLLLQKIEEDGYKEDLLKEAKNIYQDAQEALTNDTDRNRIGELYQDIVNISKE